MSLYHSGSRPGDPVEGHHGHAEREEGHEKGREASGADVEGGVLRFVLLQGAPDEDRQADEPEDEEEHRAGGEEREGRARRPCPRGSCSARPRAGRRGRGPAPRPGPRGPRARAEEQGGEALRDAAHGHAPPGAHQVLEGHDEERAQGDGQEKDEPEEPVGPEPLRAREGVGRADAEQPRTAVTQSVGLELVRTSLIGRPLPSAPRRPPRQPLYRAGHLAGRSGRAAGRARSGPPPSARPRSGRRRRRAWRSCPSRWPSRSCRRGSP